MPVLHFFRSLKSCVAAATVLISIPCFSQGRHNSTLQLEGFAIKTDLFPLLNTITDKEINSYFITGEIYFNDEYSFNIDATGEKLSNRGLEDTEKRWGCHVRWYLKQDDCNCSALFIGGYLSRVNFKQSVDHNLYLNNLAMSYEKNSIEGGLCGGYQMILANHFVIDPWVQVGLEIHNDIISTECTDCVPSNKNNGLLLKVLLEIGYRF